MSGAPAAKRSFALILDDYEARYGDGFIYWAAYNIPATTTQLAANAGATEPDLTAGGKHAYNDFLRRRYDGPVRRKARPTVTASRFARSISPRSTMPARR